MTTAGTARRRATRLAAAGLAAAGLAAAATAAAGGCTAPPADTAGPVTTITAVPVVTLAPPSQSDAILARARSFVYRVRNDGCLATGTAFSVDGLAVTNRHVAAGTSTLQLSTWEGTDFGATVSDHDTAADLARLRTQPPPGSSQATLATLDPGTYTQVWVTGYPGGGQLSVAAGEVLGQTSGTALGIEGNLLEISNRVEPGNSGSPLLDSSGRVVGVVFATDTDTGDGLAIPVSLLRSYLAGAGSTAPVACTE